MRVLQSKFRKTCYIARFTAIAIVSLFTIISVSIFTLKSQQQENLIFANSMTQDTQDDSISLLPTATPTPLVESPLAVEPRHVLTPFQLEQLISWLPKEAEPMLDQLWSPGFGCNGGSIISQVPYRLADGKLNLLAVYVVNSPTPRVLWDSRVEQNFPETWNEFRPTDNYEQQNGFTFFGKSQSGEWWIGVIADLCNAPHLQVLLPIKEPTEFTLQMSNHLEALHYWLFVDRKLSLFEVVNHQAMLKWTFDHPYADSASTIWMDLTGDGKDELVLRWGVPATSWQSNKSKRVGPFQLFQWENESFRLLGEVEADLQYVDVDHDGMKEFLRPFPLYSPYVWQTYRWQGDHFEWSEPLSYPSAPQTDYPDPNLLPPIPQDFYFRRDGVNLHWAQAGGVLQVISDLPTVDIPQCGMTMAEMEARRTISFSADCNFALTNISGGIEGSSNGILNRQSDQIQEIRGTFTYIRGHSTFAWDLQNRYLVHARADGGAGIYRFDLTTNENSTIIDFNSLDLYGGTYAFGAIDPFVFSDESLGFSFQSAYVQNYPPPGIYRLNTQKQLQRLAAIPPLIFYPSSAPNYGLLRWSPDGSMFLYFLPRQYSVEGNTVTYSAPYDVLLLGTTNPSRVWDLNPIFGDADSFGW